MPTNKKKKNGRGKKGSKKTQTHRRESSNKNSSQPVLPAAAGAVTPVGRSSSVAAPPPTRTTTVLSWADNPEISVRDEGSGKYKLTKEGKTLLLDLYVHYNTCYNNQKMEEPPSGDICGRVAFALKDHTEISTKQLKKQLSGDLLDALLQLLKEEGQDEQNIAVSVANKWFYFRYSGTRDIVSIDMSAFSSAMVHFLLGGVIPDIPSTAHEFALDMYRKLFKDRPQNGQQLLITMDTFFESKETQKTFSEIYTSSSGSALLPEDFLLTCPFYKLEESVWDEILSALLKINFSGNIEEKERTLSELYQFKTDFIAATVGLIQGLREMKGKCWECGDKSKGKKLMTCSKCCVAAYCSRECQRAAWIGGHRYKCEDVKERFSVADAALDDVVDHWQNINVSQDASDVTYGRFDFDVSVLMALMDPLVDPTMTGLGIDGPSMKYFYDNVAAIYRGDWWFFPNPSTTFEDFERITSTKRVSFVGRKQIQLSFDDLLCLQLCYDLQGYAMKMYGEITSDTIRASLPGRCLVNIAEESLGVQMPIEVFDSLVGGLGRTYKLARDQKREQKIYTEANLKHMRSNAKWRVCQYMCRNYHK